MRLASLFLTLLFLFLQPDNACAYTAHTNQQQVIDDNFAIYVINLARRTDRWQTIQSKLQAQNLPYQRHEALDGKKTFPNPQAMVSQGYVDPQAMADDPYLTPGMVALALSARAVWQRCSESGKPYCVILEDDFLLAADFSERLYKLSHIIQRYDFDVLMLHQNVYGFWGSAQDQQNRYNAEWVARDNPDQIIPSIFGFSAAAYVIKASSARKLIQAYSLPIDASVDIFWWGTAKKHAHIYPEAQFPILTAKPAADAITVMQTHPLWYRNVCATSSQCHHGDPTVKDSEIYP